MDQLSIRLSRRPSGTEVEKLCSVAEDTVEQVIENRIGFKHVEDLRVTVRADGTKPLRLTVDLDLTPSHRSSELDSILGEATDAAFSAVERKALELKLCRKAR